MSQSLDEIRGRRYLIKTTLGNFYFWVSLTDMMITVPAENSLENAEIRALLETNCRLASKGLKAGLTLVGVAAQMIKGGAGRSPVLVEIAERILDFCGEGV